MPSTEKTVTKIVCDNEGCPGNVQKEQGLKATDRAGWLFVSSEHYGWPTVQSVYCSTDCLAVVAKENPETLIGSEPEAPQPEPEPTK